MTRENDVFWKFEPNPVGEKVRVLDTVSGKTGIVQGLHYGDRKIRLRFEDTNKFSDWLNPDELKIIDREPRPDRQIFP